MGSWIELRLVPGCSPSAVYNQIRDAESAHHFWNEPWWPGAYVVRLQGVKRKRARRLDEVDHVVKWDPSPDREFYGAAWVATRDLFAASSRLAGHRDFAARHVHCYLNARGMSPRQEAIFAAKFCWNRLTIGLRWRLYLRRRWEREQDA